MITYGVIMIIINLAFAFNNENIMLPVWVYISLSILMFMSLCFIYYIKCVDTKIVNTIAFGLVCLIYAIKSRKLKYLFGSYKTIDIKDYGKYEGTFYYEPAILPKQLLSNMKIKSYRYIMKPSLVGESQYILLECQWSDKDFKDEIERISNIHDEYGKVTYAQTTFALPAYVYLYNEGDNSEYALIDEENKTISYVYVQNPFDFEKESYVIAQDCRQHNSD